VNLWADPWDCEGVAYLYWDAVPNATSYVVERKFGASTTWTVLDPAWPIAGSYEAFGNGTYTWRIKANCGGGSGSYSVESTYIVRFGRWCDPYPYLRPAAQKAQLKLNPQPANGQVSISFNWEKQATGVITVRNQYGISLKQQQVQIRAGKNLVVTDISGIKPGMYFVYLRADGQTVSQKLVIGN
jgi:Secretion system C-terminal sorting domain